jgi:hypothetical protein
MNHTKRVPRITHTKNVSIPKSHPIVFQGNLTAIKTNTFRNKSTFTVEALFIEVPQLVTTHYPPIFGNPNHNQTKWQKSRTKSHTTKFDLKNFNFNFVFKILFKIM